MTTIPILAQSNCHPCCWFAKEKRCHCSCHGTNHGSLHPSGPKDTRQRTTLTGRDYQTTLFPASPTKSRVLQVPAYTTTQPDRTPVLADCVNCAIPTITRKSFPTNRCPSCTNLRASHRAFVLARSERLAGLRGTSAPDTQPALDLDQDPAPPHQPAQPWYLLP